MHLIIQSPFAAPIHLHGTMRPARSLGTALAHQIQYVQACCVNGQFREDWQSVVPTEMDTVVFYTDPGVVEGSLAATLLYAAIATVVSTAISIGLSYLIRALTPVPSNTAGKPEQVYGIAGLTNTTALGTPKFLVYGTRRVFGHILDTRVQVSPDGKTTMFGILYFMGEGPIQSLSAIEINDTPAEQFPGLNIETRLGAGSNAPIPGFDMTSTVWADNRQLAEATPIVYTTRGSAVERATLIFATPYLFAQDSRGNHIEASHTLTIEVALVSDGIYGDAPGSPFTWTDNAEAARFRSFLIELASADAWLIRVTLTATTNAQGTVPSLFNVQEDTAGGSTYDNDALLAITGIASSQIQSFEQMRASALEQGRVIHKPVISGGSWDGSTYEDAWSDNRAWVLRDLMTDVRVGLGNRIPASLWDDESAVAAALYWDIEPIGGTKRDQCNVIIGDRRAAWDWIKMILQEAQSLLLPVDGKFKLIVDQDGTPDLVYAFPGNIIEGSIDLVLGDGQGRISNTIRGQFPDATNNYTNQVLQVVADDIGSEPTIETFVSLATITNATQAYWLLRRELLRQRQVQRRYRWQSPQTALVSEPFDHVAVVYDTTNYARGISGYCPAGSTVSRLLLDRQVTLAAATTYEIRLRHQADNTVETRLVSTVAGIWGAVAPTVNFTTAPAEGDLWAIGVQNTALTHVLIESISVEEDVYTLEASEYVAALYDYPAPPAEILPPAAMNRRPLLLWHASAVQVQQMGDDGVSRGYIQFGVTPQLLTYAGTVAGTLVPANQIRLGTTEPYLETLTMGYSTFMDDYYQGAHIDLVEGTGAGQSRVISGSTQTWDGVNPPLTIATVDVNWLTLPDTTTIYVIRWDPHADTVGFRVESTTDVAGDPATLTWVEVGQFSGLTASINAPVDSSNLAYRFTALSPGNIAAIAPGDWGRYIVALTIVGDTTAPDPPAEEAGEA